MRTPRRALALSAVVLFWSVVRPVPRTRKPARSSTPSRETRSTPVGPRPRRRRRPVRDDAVWRLVRVSARSTRSRPTASAGTRTRRCIRFRATTGRRPSRRSCAVATGCSTGRRARQRSPRLRNGVPHRRGGDADDPPRLRPFRGQGAHGRARRGRRLASFTARRPGRRLAHGSVFRIDLSGSNFAVLHAFDDEEGGPGRAGVVLGGSFLYGTTHRARGYFAHLPDGFRRGGHAAARLHGAPKGGSRTRASSSGPTAQLYGTPAVRRRGRFRHDVSRGHGGRVHPASLLSPGGGVRPRGPARLRVGRQALWDGAARAGPGASARVFRTSTGGTFEKLFDFSHDRRPRRRKEHCSRSTPASSTERPCRAAAGAPARCIASTRAARFESSTTSRWPMAGRPAARSPRTATARSGA